MQCGHWVWSLNPAVQISRKYAIMVIEPSQCSPSPLCDGCSFRRSARTPRSMTVVLSIAVPALPTL